MLLLAIETSLKAHPHVATLEMGEGEEASNVLQQLQGSIHTPVGYFPEEERSKQVPIRTTPTLSRVSRSTLSLAVGFGDTNEKSQKICAA